MSSQKLINSFEDNNNILPIITEASKLSPPANIKIPDNLSVKSTCDDGMSISVAKVTSDDSSVASTTSGVETISNTAYYPSVSKKTVVHEVPTISTDHRVPTISTGHEVPTISRSSSSSQNVKVEIKNSVDEQVTSSMLKQRLELHFLKQGIYNVPTNTNKYIFFSLSFLFFALLLISLLVPLENITNEEKGTTASVFTRIIFWTYILFMFSFPFVTTASLKLYGITQPILKADDKIFTKNKYLLKYSKVTLFTALSKIINGNFWLQTDHIIPNSNVCLVDSDNVIEISISQLGRS